MRLRPAWGALTAGMEDRDLHSIADLGLGATGRGTRA